MTYSALEALQGALAEAGGDVHRAKAIFETHVTPQRIAEILGKDKNQDFIKRLFPDTLVDHS